MQIDELFARTNMPEPLRINVDLLAQRLDLPDGNTITFTVDPFRRHCLLEGFDDIGLTLQHIDAIRAYEERRRKDAPWLFA